MGITPLKTAHRGNNVDAEKKSATNKQSSPLNYPFTSTVAVLFPSLLFVMLLVCQGAVAL